MEAMIGEAPKVYRTKVDTSGRVVLPAEVRLRQRIRPGDEVLLRETGDGVEVRTLGQAVRDAQALFGRLAPPATLLSDELIRDRRNEASRGETPRE